MISGRIDQEHGAAPEQRKRGTPLWKSGLFAVLSALAVFVVWLLYPVSAPAYSLQRYFPQECFAVAESHSPAAFSAGVQRQDFFGNLRRLPLWPHLSAAIREQTGTAIEPNLDQLNTALNAAAGQLFGLRDIKAAAASPLLTEQGGQELAALLVVDNIGLSLAKIGITFSGSQAGSPYRYQKLPRLGKDTPDLYLALVPGTRYVLIASNPEIFSRFRFSSAGPEEDFAALSRTSGTVLALQQKESEPVSPESSVVTLRLRLAPEVLQALLPAQMRGAAAQEVKADFYWNLLAFGGSGSLPLPGAGGKELAAGVYLPPAGFTGLGLSCALPSEAAAMLTQLLAVPGKQPARSALRQEFGGISLNDFSAKLPPEARKFLTASFLPHLDGRGYVSFGAAGAGAFWGVKDPAAARKAFVGGLAGALADYSRRETDLMTQMVLSGIKIEPTAAGAELRLPFFAQDATPWCAFGSGPAGAFGALRCGRGEGFAPSGNMPALPGLLGQGCLIWRHSPQLLADARAALGAGGGLGSVLGGMDPEFAQILPHLLRVLDVFDSFQDFTAGYSLYQGQSGEGRLSWEFAGDLRQIR